MKSKYPSYMKDWKFKRAANQQPRDHCEECIHFSDCSRHFSTDKARCWNITDCPRNYFQPKETSKPKGDQSNGNESL